MTLAGKLRKEGYDKGIQQGIQQGLSRELKLECTHDAARIMPLRSKSPACYTLKNQRT